MPYAHTFMTGRYLFSNAKAKKDLGWKPQYPSYHEGLLADAGAIASA
jgi:nucleoside-diphosphate-sugar epimerase